ncbi:MAG: hypothetical protein DYH15_12240 [Nitrosomonas sp. PRO4]|nr:hypothetical protein [Nitrosomonas sp. PRO4]
MNRKSLHQTSIETNHFARGGKMGIAACAITVTPTGEVQLFPAGEFRASDGRPKDAPHWFIDAELAAAIIADFEARQNLTVIDYEHQTMLTVENGQPAPAAGWFSKLEWRDTGLYAVNVDWTDRASQMIGDGEYKYISPVFTYDKKTGAIKSLLNAALTNNPALDGMEAVAASQYSQLINQQPDMETLKMEGLMEQLRWLLNLPVTATADEITAELQKAIDQIKAAAASAVSVPGFDVATLVKTQAEQIATLTASAANPDPSRFVPVEDMSALHLELAKLRNENLEREVTDVVSKAIAEGRLLPSQEAWARALGGVNMQSLKDYIATSQPIAALTGTQTGGTPPEGDSQLDTQNAAAIAEAARKYQSEQAALGITVTTAQAVNFVTRQVQ